eukprot:2525574-Lingulodinium_polyedra.AAC.1
MAVAGAVEKAKADDALSVGVFLDLAKAFDSDTPEQAIAVLVELGLPAPVECVLLAFYGSRE